MLKIFVLKSLVSSFRKIPVTGMEFLMRYEFTEELTFTLMVLMIKIIISFKLG